VKKRKKQKGTRKRKDKNESNIEVNVYRINGEGWGVKKKILRSKHCRFPTTRLPGVFGTTLQITSK
jgi:hypothetical protein